MLVLPLQVAPEQEAACAEWLSADERSRADRFVHADTRRRFVVCRGSLRRELADMLAIAPADIAFAYQRWGKPELVHPRRAGLHFNVSHSEDWALLAFAESPLGIDLERVNPRVRYRELADHLLSPGERPLWQALGAAEQERAALQLWVCKEAFLKGLGVGIAEGLRHISLPLPLPDEEPFAPLAVDPELQLQLEEDANCRRNHWLQASAWRLRLLQIVPQSCAAVCLPRSISSLIVDRSRMP